MHSETVAPTRYSGAAYSPRITFKSRTFDKHTEAVVVVFVLSLLVCWSPLKTASYGVPFIAIFLMAFLSHDAQVLVRFFKVTLVFLAIVLACYITQPNFLVQNSVVVFITYGTATFLLSVPAYFFRSTALIQRLLKFVYPTIFLQATIGIVQAAYGALQSGTFDVDNGDKVEGTIHIQLESESSLSNPMFAVNIAALLLLCITDRKRTTVRRWIIALGSLAFILASVMHVILILSVAFVIAALYVAQSAKQTRRIIAGLIVILVLLIPVAFLLEKNLNTLPMLIDGMNHNEIPRAKLVQRVFTVMPERYPWMPLIGIGPGQFTSRAGLICTGFYLGGFVNQRSLPLIKPQTSEPLQLYQMDLWAGSAMLRGYGSTHQPFFSWISFYTEFGGILFVAAFVMAIRVCYKFRRAVRAGGEINKSLAGIAGTILIFSLGMQENYWELPQAIFILAFIIRILLGSPGQSTNIVRHVPLMARSMRIRPA